MIIRKPYAFLIKNFRKIHIALLILSLYIAYKIFDVSNFVNQFMDLGIYDLYADPVTNHITGFMMFSVFILIIGSGLLLLLLRHKNKPWKMYLIPFVFYISLFLILNIIKSFFRVYTTDVETTDLRMSRDLLMIFLIVQLPAIGVFLMRILGVDIGKFNFNTDQEFLELSDADREEVEISLDIDINTFKRLYRRLIRNIKYFYEEHKVISRIVIGTILIIIIYNIYSFIFVTNKVYKMGENYNYDGFIVNIKNAYVTDKDCKNEVVSKNSKFIILDVSVKNNSMAPRNFNTSNFHIKAGSNDYSTTETVYSKEFADLGESYSKVKSINSEQNLDFIIVFKVNEKISNNRFVLFYQERNGLSKLRKIKLKLSDISKVNSSEKYDLGDSFSVNVKGNEETLSFDSYELLDSTSYSTKECSFGNCSIVSKEFSVSSDYKILMIEFASDDWETKNMIDFFDRYGKIIYKDSSGDEESLDIDFALKNKYYGKVVYLKVPTEMVDAKSVALNFVVRNLEINYKLK